MGLVAALRYESRLCLTCRLGRLVLTLLVLSAVPALAVTNQWATTVSLPEGRSQYTATLLASGKILVVGGLIGSSPRDGATDTAALYDPASNAWTAAAPMGTPRFGHTATLLPSGKVLVVGGNGGRVTGTGLASTELYDPDKNTWTPAVHLGTARYGHTATLLPTGHVLVAGGYRTYTVTATAELYDPVSGTWSYTTNMMTIARVAHTATLLPSGDVLIAGGDTGSPANPIGSAELYHDGSWQPAASGLTARTFHTATLLSTGSVLVAGGYGGANNLASAQLYNPNTNTWSDASTNFAARASHSATLLPSGDVLVAGGQDSNFLSSTSAQLYDPASDQWTPVGSIGNLTVARMNHDAILLPSGQVLVAGGKNSTGALTSAEMFDASAGAWPSADASTMATGRDWHTATPLPSGKVLVAGGGHSGEGSSALADSELFDPITNTWSPASAMASARVYHTSTLLPSGKVLVAAGFSDTFPTGRLASAELYDSATNTWSGAGSLATARDSHTATLLPSGKVLVAGGYNANGYLVSGELYDSATNTWSAAGSLATARAGHTATLLTSGKVLVAGGYNANGYLASAELYDPPTDTWSSAGSMATARTVRNATLLPSGKVLVAGGYDGTAFLGTAELYDPATNAWSPAGSLVTGRSGATTTLLPSGRVLAAGGTDGTTLLNTAELYDPATNTWSAAGTLAMARIHHSATLLASDLVLVAGGEDGFTAFASAELFDPGLVPDDTRQPSLGSVSPLLFQRDALVATAAGSSTASGAVTSTGFMPLLEASSGATNNSASNAPVFQVQRIDNEQMRFVANDETVNMSDTQFTGRIGALVCFSPGPARVRVWVNGVPSATQYIVVASDPVPSDLIFANSFETCP